MAAARFLVSGRVQGVWFRASTREVALQLGLHGYAANLVDGRVEVVVSGPDAAIDQLAQWLERGPPAARVTSLQRLDIDGATQVPGGFAIR